MSSAKPEPAPDAAARTTGGYVLEEQVGHILRRVHQRASAVFQELIGDPQVTPMQFAAMVKLYERGELSQNHLGRLAAMDPATVQGVIRRLQDRDLILARADPDDRRRVLLRLSPEGEALTRGPFGSSRAMSAAILAPLTATERRVFLSLLKRLA